MRLRPDPTGPGQESVWGYPRPAVVEASDRHVRVEHRGSLVADTHAPARTLETSHPLSWHLPPADVAMHLLRASDLRSLCEWKGQAVYWHLEFGGKILRGVAWSYPDPTRAFVTLRDHFAFYAAPLDLCTIDGERVKPQLGGFTWVLWRLDRIRSRRSVQGNSRKHGMVTMILPPALAGWRGAPRMRPLNRCAVATRDDATQADGASGLSPYLHFGVIGPREVMAQVVKAKAGAQHKRKFADELLGWREWLFFKACPLQVPERYDRIAGWARATLADHAGDPRPRRWKASCLG